MVYYKRDALNRSSWVQKTYLVIFKLVLDGSLLMFAMGFINWSPRLVSALVGRLISFLQNLFQLCSMKLTVKTFYISTGGIMSAGIISLEPSIKGIKNSTGSSDRMM